MGISSGLGSSALLPAGLGFRNKFINGDFRINQRGLTSTGTVNGVALINGQYGFDRWAFGFSGGTATCSAQTFAVGNAIDGQEPTNYMRLVTSGQSGGNYSHVYQRIEDVRTCAGQQVILSFWAKADAARSVSIEIQQGFGSGGSPSATVLTYAGKISLTTSWSRYWISFVVPSIAGKTIGTNNDHYVGIAFFVSAGTGFESRTDSLGIQNGTFDFWGMQLEQNYQPTPFEQRPYGVELQLCQRYYEQQGTLATSGSYLLVNALYLASTTWYVNASYKVTKRVAVTPTVYTSGTFAGIDKTFVDGFNAYWYSNGVIFGFTANAEL